MRYPSLMACVFDKATLKMKKLSSACWLLSPVRLKPVLPVLPWLFITVPRHRGNSCARLTGVVVDPGHVPEPRSIKNGPPELAAYVAVGEVQPSRPYAAAIPAAWIKGENKDWGSRLIDQAQPGGLFFLQNA